MTLTEFLLTADADDVLALAAAQAHTETQGKLIPRNTMNSILAQALLYNDFLEASPTNDLIAAFMDVSSTEYNFIQSNPAGTGDQQIAALDTLIAGDYPTLAALKPTLIALCNVPYKPFESTTMAQVKAIRYPATAELCVHPSGMDYAVSASSKDLFSFVTVLTEDCTGIDVSIRWREDGTQPWKVFSSPIRLQGGYSGESLSQVMARPRGIKDARHFEFSFTGQYAGQISTVNVTVSQ